MIWTVELIVLIGSCLVVGVVWGLILAYRAWVTHGPG